jgi:hypothetical protein
MNDDEIIWTGEGASDGEIAFRVAVITTSSV